MNQSNNQLTIDPANRNLSPKYLQYIHYLYGNTIQLTCDFCKQRGTLIRNYDKDQNIWLIQCNKCNTKIEMKQPKLVQLENYKIKMIYENENIMSRVLEIVHMNNVLQKRNKLIEYQKKYRTNIQITSKIHSILNDQQNHILEQQRKQFELLQKIVENNVQMKKYYEKNEKPISLETKKLLYQVYKNEKNPSDVRLKQLEKDIKIPIKEIENWLQYFSYFEKYMNVQRNLNQLSQEISAQLKHFQMKNTNFFLSNESVTIIPGSGSRRQHSLTSVSPKKTNTGRPPVSKIPRITVKTETDSNVVNIKTQPVITTPIPNTQPNTNKPNTSISTLAQAPMKKKLIIKKQKGGNLQQIQQSQQFKKQQQNMQQDQEQLGNHGTFKNREAITESFDFLDLMNNTYSEKLIKKNNAKHIKDGGANVSENLSEYTNIKSNTNNIESNINNIPPKVNNNTKQIDYTHTVSSTMNHTNQTNENNINNHDKMDKEQYREVVFH